MKPPRHLTTTQAQDWRNRTQLAMRTLANVRREVAAAMPSTVDADERAASGFPDPVVSRHDDLAAIRRDLDDAIGGCEFADRGLDQLARTVTYTTGRGAA